MTLAPEGAKCDSLDDISLLRSLLNHVGAVGYKYLVPTGLRLFCLSCVNALQQHTNGALRILRVACVQISLGYNYQAVSSLPVQTVQVLAARY